MSLTTQSVAGMSGGPLIRVNEGFEGYRPSLSRWYLAVCTAMMDTIAIPMMAVYRLRWDVPVMGASSFRELLGTQINDVGTDKLIEVMSSNGRMFIRKSRILNL